MSRFVALAALATLLACGEAPTAPAAVPVVTGGHATPAPDLTFGGLAVSCCANPAAKATVDAYVNLGEALAADKAAEGSAAWSALVTTLPALEAAQASAAAPLKAAIDGVGALPPGDIAALRAALNATFKPMRALLQANAGGGDEKVVVTYCPMKSSRWFQSNDGIANPYHGAEMLTCGVFEAL
jgi:hypothetical protein